MRKLWLVFAGSLLFHLAGSWILPLLDRDEPRFAEASREMLARGDYVVPYFNNQFRFDKPPLTYWFQTVSYRLLGENDFAARLPSAFAAALTALLIFLWARRFGGERTAWWSALIFTVCVQTFIHAKAAVADMWLVFFVTAAHWAGYELLCDRLTSDTGSGPGPDPRPSRRWWWTFYLALAFAFLAKGPIGWTPLLAILCAHFYLPTAKLNHRFLFFTGIFLMLSVVAIWAIPAFTRTDGDFYRIGIGHHVVRRSLMAIEGHGGRSWWAYLAGLPFYFVVIFITFFPWSFKLPWLSKRLWRKRDPLDNYLLTGIAVIFIVFTFVRTKLPHYTLPAFPLLALLLGKALVNQPGSERFVRRSILTAAGLALVALIASPWAAKYSPTTQLLQQARPELRPEMNFGAVDYREPSLIWYFRKYVDGWFTDVDGNDVPAFMEKPGARFIVMPTSQATRVYPATPQDWKRYQARGFSSANFKRVDLTLLLKPQ